MLNLFQHLSSVMLNLFLHLIALFRFHFPGNAKVHKLVPFRSRNKFGMTVPKITAIRKKTVMLNLFQHLSSVLLNLFLHLIALFRFHFPGNAKVHKLVPFRSRIKSGMTVRNGMTVQKQKRNEKPRHAELVSASKCTFNFPLSRS